MAIRDIKQITCFALIAIPVIITFGPDITADTKPTTGQTVMAIVTIPIVITGRFKSAADTKPTAGLTVIFLFDGIVAIQFALTVPIIIAITATGPRDTLIFQCVLIIMLAVHATMDGSLAITYCRTIITIVVIITG